jgi:glycosyltransferase involved in cell wall biosynthesis
MISASMPRFAGMIRRGMMKRGNEVEIWTSPQRLGRLPIQSSSVRKWLGYADQFLLYPRELRRRVNQQSRDTLFVITDQALGIWVPHLAHRPHVIHCHDFLALRSSLGEFQENLTGWSGQQYQRLIRKGFSQGTAFISDSEKTREDLHRFLPRPPKISEMVYVGLNHPFRPMTSTEQIPLLQQTGLEIPKEGFIFHVGGNQWYKNRKGVVEIYRAYAALNSNPTTLWMAGEPPSGDLAKFAADIPKGKIHFLLGLTNEQVNAAYSHAKALLFPSLGEGFGWPIAEAMASACPVITTNAAPMTEVAGGAARLIPRMPVNDKSKEREEWANSAAGILNEVVCLDEDNRSNLLQQGELNADRFNTETALSSYEEIYYRALDQK